MMNRRSQADRARALAPRRVLDVCTSVFAAASSSSSTQQTSSCGTSSRAPVSFEDARALLPEA